MDNKKQYTPEEAARKVLEHVEKLYKSSMLYKTNTAHEVEAGSEPMDNGAECPPSLAAQGESSSESPKSFEESSKEDMGEDEEKKKKKKKEDEEEEDYQEEAEEEKEEYKEDKDKVISDVSKDKKPFEKSEKIKKKDRCWEGYEPTPGKKPYSEGSCRKETKKSMDQGQAHTMMKSKYSVDEAVSHIMGDKKVDEVMEHMSPEDRKKVLAGLRSKDAKKAEMCKGYMMKCGEMKKKEDKKEKMKIDLKKKPKNLKEFLKKKKMKKCGDMKMGKNMAPADAPQDKQGKMKQQEAQEPQDGSSKMGY
jgi:hypothetical protein